MKETNKFREMTLEIHTLTKVPIYEGRQKKSLVKCASRRECVFVVIISRVGMSE
jgi:hypothetical protein